MRPPGTAGYQDEPVVFVEAVFPPGAAYPMPGDPLRPPSSQQQQQQQPSHAQQRRQMVDEPVKNPSAALRLARCVPKVVDGAMRAAGPVLVAGCWVLIGLVVWFYFADILPLSGQSPLGPQTVLGLTLLFFIVYNHVQAVFTHPGRSPEAPEAVKARMPELIAADHARLREAGARAGFALYCKHCLRQKPPRTHHCSICGECVLKMDHHCPWIGNCVGFANVKYFYRFLLFMDAGTLFVCATGGTQLWRHGVAGVADRDAELWMAHRDGVTFAVVLCASAFTAVSMMLAMHTYLLARNVTTIEMHYNRDRRKVEPAFRHPYDLGSWRANFEQVFGRPAPYLGILSWLLPGAREVGTGLSFPTWETHDPDEAVRSMSLNKALDHLV